MYFKSLELNEWCQHHHLKVEFDRHLNGMVGANGSGKSNVLAAMEYLVTGTCPTEGVKADNVNVKAKKSAESYVFGSVVHGPHEVQIVRGLRKVKSEVRLDGGKPVFGDDAVNKVLSDLFGDAMTLFERYVFVKQGRMYGFLTATPGKRAEEYQYLFGTRPADRAYKALGDALSGVAVADNAAEVDEVSRRLADARGRLANLKRELAAYDDLEGFDADDDPDSRTVANYKRYREAVAEYREAAAGREACKAAVLRANREVDLASKSVVAAGADVSDRGGEYEDARDAIEAWSGFDKDVARLDKAERELRNRLRKLTDERDARPEPRRPFPYYEDGGVEQDEIRTLSDQVARDRPLVEAFRGGVTTCPTCGTTTDNRELAERVAEVSARFDAEESRLRLLVFVDHKSRAYDQSLAAWQTWREAWSSNYDATCGEVIRLTASRPEPPLVDRPDDDAVHDRFLEAENAHARAWDALAKRTAKFMEAKAAFKAAKQRRLKAAQDKALYKTSKADYKAARKVVAERSRRFQRRGELKGESQATRRRVKEDKELLARLKGESARADATHRFLAHAQALRSVLHKDGLPREVARGYLGLLESGVNEFLAAFDARFSVTTRDDLSYEVTHDDGTVQPASRLSGGQKMLLAWAFRCETNATFARDIGVLCLDEPTDSLDAKNAKAVEVAVGKLRALSAGRGLQVVLVTHVARLGRLFDRTIRL